MGQPSGIRNPNGLTVDRGQFTPLNHISHLQAGHDTPPVL
jgi:hypothetical protein